MAGFKCRDGAGRGACMSQDSPGLKRRSASRQPTYAVPIWKISSPLWRWYDDNPPSPVLCSQPTCLAPRLSAVIALPDSDPTLIAGRVASRATVTNRSTGSSPHVVTERSQVPAPPSSAGPDVEDPASDGVSPGLDHGVVRIIG